MIKIYLKQISSIFKPSVNTDLSHQKLSTFILNGESSEEICVKKKTNLEG